jgi:hypothetical protein
VIPDLELLQKLLAIYVNHHIFSDLEKSAQIPAAGRAGAKPRRGAEDTQARHGETGTV